jgi:hypothetical protein
VLSPSTAAFNRGSEFQSYRHIASLNAHVLIDPALKDIEIFCRNADIG